MSRWHFLWCCQCGAPWAHQWWLNTCHATQVSTWTWLSPGLCHSTTIYQFFPHSHCRTTVLIDLICLTLLFLAFNSQNVSGKTCKNAKKVTMIRLTSKLPLSLAIEFFPLTQLKQGLFKVSLSIMRSWYITPPAGSSSIGPGRCERIGVILPCQF